MDVFKFNCYKKFVNKHIQSLPQNGRGEYGRIANSLNISSVMVSQVFKGDKELSNENAFLLTEYLGLKKLESQYFLLLVQFARAGHFKLKEHIQEELEAVKKHASDLSKNVSHQAILTEEQKNKFYSDWSYSAVRLIQDIKPFQKEELVKILRIELSEVEKIISFLIETGLLKKSKGNLQLGPTSTHLSKDSNQIKMHHSNWRINSLNTINQMDSSEIMYTAPMAVSKKTYENLHKNIFKLINQLVDEAQESEAEGLYYLNIDLRKIFEID